jgi:hypothetical protein
MLRLPTAAVLAAALLPLAACGSDNSTPTSPTTPAVQVTETLEGDLPPSSGRVHTFAVQSAGTVSATLTEITPSDTVVGLDLGTWTGVSCQINVARPSTAQGQAVAGTATTVATLCIRIYDVSDTGLPASVHYKIDVSHF